MKKVLILHTSVGLGHKSMAENIAWQLESVGLEVRLADIGQVQRGRFEKVVVAVHQFINLHLPFVWAWLYDWGHYIIYPFRVFIAQFNSGALKKLILEYQPDLIISDHTTSSAVVTYLRRARVYTKQFGIAFSDYHLHPYWLYKGADFYLANIIEQKIEMVRRGISADKIFVCGMTLKPKLVVDVNKVKQKLNIGPEEKVILVGSGSLGTGFKEGLLDELSKMANTKVLVVCGKNEEYKKYLEAKYIQTNILPLGYYSPMGELYALADIFFTKPGGLTVAESLQYNLPTIITHILPGQEQLNLDYLLDKELVEQVSGAVIEQINRAGLRKALLQTNPNVQPIVSPAVTVKSVVLERLN
ncbi:MAG: glycosyltransferase [Candidatus Doudnabacteria bacterium]|jgi:UDP-N-acetylglucosamine:LPS N-acetylglucosamine transferase